VVLAAVPFVERPCVLSVQVAHAVGQVRQRRLEEQVVVVAEQAARVQLPAVAASHTTEDLREHGSVEVVDEDRRVVVPFRSDVVIGAGFDMTERASHVSDRSPVNRGRQALCAFRRTPVTASSRARHKTGELGTCPPAQADTTGQDIAEVERARRP
jgi:hypothetical protein